MTVDIIRRDTLAAKHQVGSPLTRLSAVYADVLASQPGGTPAISDLVPAQGPTAARRPGRKSRPPLNPTSTVHGGPSRGRHPCPAWKEATS